MSEAVPAAQVPAVVYVGVAPAIVVGLTAPTAVLHTSAPAVVLIVFAEISQHITTAGRKLATVALKEA
jgi:hypothetical protein